MSSFFHCASYSDIDSAIRIEKDAIFIVLEDEKNDVDLHITLNPFQVLTLAKYLYAIVTEIKVLDVFKSQFLGNMTVQIENENIDAENLKIPIERQNEELFYYDEVANG